MAFPSIAGTTKFAASANGTSHNVAYPTISGGILANDLAILVVGADSGATTINTPTTGGTWGVLLASTALPVGGTVSHRGAVFYKWMAGGETGNVAVTLAATERIGAILHIIRGANPSFNPEAGAFTSTTTASANADPASFTPVNGAQDYMWMPALIMDDSAVGHTPTAAPANYSNLQTQTGSSGATVATADRTLNAASENPGAWTHTSETWGSTVIAIRGAAAAQNLQQAITATGSATPTLRNQARSTLTATSAGAVTLVREARTRLIGATGATGASYGARSVTKTFAATSPVTPTLVKQARTSFSATGAATATLAVTRVVMQMIAAAAAGACKPLGRLPQPVLTATAGATGAITKAPAITRAAAAGATASFVKRAQATRAATAGATATLAVARATSVVLTATAGTVVSLVKRAATRLTAAAGGSATQEAIQPQNDVQTEISATATGVASFGEPTIIPKPGDKPFLRGIRSRTRFPNNRPR